MRRVARIGLGASLLTGLGAAAVKIRRQVAARREARRARADEARRNLWPPVPVRPGAEARIEADHAETPAGAAAGRASAAGDGVGGQPERADRAEPAG
jgi:hypothetical protein